jgi:hypothetical protein
MTREDTIRRLNIIYQMLTNMKTFSISGLLYGNEYIYDIKNCACNDTCVPIQIVTKGFEPKNDIGKIVIFSWLYTNGSACNTSYSDLYETSREILIMIRDNHNILIEDLDQKQNVSLWWDRSTDLSLIATQTTEYREQKQQAGTYDEDFHIKPIFEPKHDYVIGDVCTWLTNDDIISIKKVFTDSYYNDFLLSTPGWDPRNLVPHLTSFDALPLDDFKGRLAWDLALHICANNNSLKCAQYLLEQNAHVNTQNRGGQTALNIAMRYDYVELVLLLLSYGADPNIKDKAHETAIDVGKRRGSKNSLKLFESGNMTKKAK